MVDRKSEDIHKHGEEMEMVFLDEGPIVMDEKVIDNLIPKVVGKCLICGEDVLENYSGFLEDSGFVTLNFGFGSKNDMDIFESHIHDKCFETVKDRVKEYR